MKRTARWAFVAVSLLIVAWVAVYGGSGAQAPDGPALPTVTDHK